MRIHQVLVSASPWDSITNSALALRDVLRQVTESEVFAKNVHPGVADEVSLLREYGRDTAGSLSDDIVIFHHSIGDPEVHGFVTERPERIVVYYHNISPADAFRPYDPGFAGLLDAGRRELADLAPRVELALAPSGYNASELSHLGYRDVRVAPLIVDMEAMKELGTDPGTDNHLEVAIEGPMVLFVGQLLPHKRPDFLIQAFHFLSTYLLPEAHLVMVGAARLAEYARSLQVFIEELGLHRAWLTGAVPTETLLSFYSHADLFVTASEHEGFCIPLVEAMAHELPIVARDFAAIPETLGAPDPAAIVLAPDDGPAVLAEALHAVITDTSVRGDLVTRSRQRVGAFDPDLARAAMLGHLLSIA